MHRSGHGGPAVHARGKARDVVHHDPVGQADAAHGNAHGRVQHLARQAAPAVHAPRRPARHDDVLDRRRGVSGGDRHRGSPVPQRPERVPFPGPLGCRDEGKLDRCRVDLAGDGRPGRLQRGRGLTERNHGHRHLVYLIRPGQHRHPRIREAGMERNAETCRVGGGQQLGEHGPRVPVHVPVTPFPVTPPAVCQRPGQARRTSAGAVSASRSPRSNSPASNRPGASRAAKDAAGPPGAR